MNDWFEGQKIVCINNKVLDTGSGIWIGAQFIEALVEGQTYVIDKIAMIYFDRIGKFDVAFLLDGIDTNYKNNGLSMMDKYGEEFYHFWNGRFMPLDKFEEEEKIDISVFKGLLSDVNDGKVKFDDEDDDGHMKPKRQLENV